MNILYSIYLYFKAALFFIILGPILILVAFFAPNYLYKSGELFCKGVFKCFNLQYNIIGDFPDTGPYILMHNHSSFLDLFFLPIVIKGKFTGVVAQKNFNIPLIGSILKRFNSIPIQRQGAIKQAISSIKIAEKRIKEGYHVAIFPEGTRTITGKLSQFKKGGFHMAINTKTKILPIIVKGLYNIKPRNRWTIRPGEATMIINKPIEVTNKTVDELLLETYNIISEKV